MIVDIEKNACTRLAAAGLGVIEIDIGSLPTGLSKPAAHARVTDIRFGASIQNRTKQKVAVVLSVFLLFSNLKSEKDRRHGAYPLVDAIVAHLMGQKLDLDIEPLQPLRAWDVTPDEYRAAGMVAYEIDFQTGYTQFAADSDDSANLVTIALSYFLKPGDQVADAEDDVQVSPPESPA